MSIFGELKTNKGTVSSELGKRLAQEVLSGNHEILQEAFELICLFPENKNEKNVRAGAAKIIETVAFENPCLVASSLERVFPALAVAEPQTRWMAIRTFGRCAKYNIDVASRAVPYAAKYIREKIPGQLCLVSSADIFLGDYGENSEECAAEVFPILMESLSNAILNEENWILESFAKIVNLLAGEHKLSLMKIASSYISSKGKKTKRLAEELLGKAKIV